MNFARPGQEARAYGARGAAKSTAGSVYRIEGEIVTAAQIAERLGIPKTAALKRMRKLRSASGPITWARLAA